MTLKDFIKKMKVIKKRGYVKSKRKGPTGIGFTLETLLGIKENNLATPDYGNIELKTHRSGSNNLITLFTFNRKVWKINPMDAVKKYGSYDKNGRKGMYYTMSLKPNAYGVFLYVDNKSISVRHIDGTMIAEWDIEILTNRFNKKIPALLLVFAQTEERDGVEYFYFDRAMIMKGTTKTILQNQFASANLLLDLRLHDKGTMARNHGTGFRVKEDKLIELFADIRDLGI